MDSFEGELTPEALSNAEEALFAEALMARDAIDFLNSDLGRVLRGMAQQKREQAKEDLLRADPDDDAEAYRCRFAAAVAEQFMAFIQEALTNGKDAELRLEQLRGE